ncbi:PREDICTED: protein pelota homolog [Chaetura pelagica]|uniref:protein pelota homolog n=1 Tax=Chaetura pelagica TaxID=8897 RepID=UPI0005232D8B|nr:PREDICTED: protein pelota homolog [Chaetura pelagica]
MGPPQNKDSHLTNRDIDKAEIFNALFAFLFSTDDGLRRSQCPELEDHSCNKDQLLAGPQLVQDLLLQLDPYKSTRPDGNCPRILKGPSDVITGPPSMILRRSRESGENAVDWKLANVVPIFKKAVVMQEGLAHVCLVTPSMTLTRAKVEVNIPRKRKGNCSQHDRALERFYEQVVQAIQRHINFEVVKCVLVASPGFVREQFCDYMFQQAVKTDNKLLLENRSKFLQVHSSSGHKYALKEALCDPAVNSRLSDTKAAGEVKALDDFYKMLQHEPDRAFYGLKHVEKANEAMAIDTLLISDELFRHQDVATRARYVKLVDSVRENMGTVRIFSSLHVSGEQLGQLTGVAAILRFPVAELSDQEDESSSEED